MRHEPDGQLTELACIPTLLSNVYFCGYSAYYLDVGTFAVDGQLNNRGFVARISPMGTVKWLQSVGQSVDQADLSEIRSCKLTPDGTKLMVAGYSAEGNLTFGTVRMPTRGNEDFFVSLMDPSTGNVLSVASIGKWGAAGDGFQALAKGASGVNMFALFQTSNDATFSDTKTNITCPSTVTRGLCCVGGLSHRLSMRDEHI